MRPFIVGCDRRSHARSRGRVIFLSRRRSRFFLERAGSRDRVTVSWSVGLNVAIYQLQIRDSDERRSEMPRLKPGHRFEVTRCR